MGTLPFLIGCCPRCFRGSSRRGSSFMVGTPANSLVQKGHVSSVGRPRPCGSHTVCLATLASSPMCAHPRLIAHALLPRSKGGAFVADTDREELASELIACPLTESDAKIPTIVFVEMLRPDSGEKHRVNRNPNRTPRCEEGRMGGGVILTSSLTQTLGTFRVLFDGGLFRAPRIS